MLEVMQIFILASRIKTRHELCT